MKNIKRCLSLFLSFLIPFIGGSLTSCEDESIGIIGGADGPTAIFVSGVFGDNGSNTEENADTDEQPQGEPEISEIEIDVDGVYDSVEDVSLYLHTYGKLPSNYITKSEARKLGWEGGSVEKYAPGMCIGGSSFGNYEGILPEDVYFECDINTLGKDSRGAERLVYSDDGDIYYTADHYETFEIIYGGED